MGPRNEASLCGYVTGNPKLIPKKAGGVFVGSFQIKSQPNRKYKPLYIPCMCFNDELAIHIAENYKQGSWIQVTNGTITPDTHPKAQPNSIALVIWDIKAKRHVLNFRVTDDDYNVIRKAKPRGILMAEFLRDTVLSKAQEMT